MYLDQFDVGPWSDSVLFLEKLYCVGKQNPVHHNSNELLLFSDQDLYFLCSNFAYLI